MYGEIADSEVILAEGNLFSFFRKLEAIDERLSQECLANPNEICNEFNHENIRS